MNSLRNLMILQLREWLRVLDNDNISDEEAFHYAPDLFEIHRRYNYEMTEMLGEAHEVFHLIPEMFDLLRGMQARLDQIQASGPQYICRLQKNDDEISYLITGLANYKEAIKDFGSWLIGASSLIIADPYFFSFKETKVYRTEAAYTDAIIKILPSSLEEVEVFHLPGPNKRIMEKFKKHCWKKEIRFKNFSTREIHDRVWIKNRSEGKAIGTSFNGIGNKVAFILDLPSEDRGQFMQELYRIRNQ